MHSKTLATIFSSLILLTTAYHQIPSLTSLSTFPIQDDATCDSSDTDIVTNCFNIYFNFFNLSTNPFPSFETYQTVLDKYILAKGAVGQAAVCAQKNALSLCLSSLEQECVNFQGLTLIFNLSPESAYHYNMDYYISQYECGPGYNVTINNFFCIESCSNYEFKAEEACAIALVVGGHNAQDCAPYNTYIQCMTKVYSNYCGKTVGNWMCNAQSYGILKDVPQCQSSFTACGSI
uniref:Transmembrane protein n=1 Tax=Parastrongyloides trichosuri TaxID=131310 RepID=A0A0N4Z4L5_PARTI